VPGREAQGVLLLANVLMGIAQVLSWILWFYQLVLIGYMVISWVNADPRNPIVNFLHAATDPALRVIRRRLPTSLRYFPIDVAFLVLFGLVIFANYALVRSLMDYATVLRFQSLGTGVQG
jgi:YggT family protein